MSHFYGAGAWPGSWSANGEVTGPYAAGGAQIGGWSTSWDEMVSDSARMLRKQDPSSQTGAQVNAAVLPGFGGPASVPAHLATGYDKSSTSYFELLPGQTWDQAVPAAMPTKPQFSHSQQAPSPNVPKPIAKPSPAPENFEWVEVTSSEGWTTSIDPMAPMTPTKSRPKLETPSSPSSASQAPPSPNSAGNIKRHRDIEDELGHQDRYKTELCRSWHESGSCRYGSKCQFAHGAHELRPVMRHPKYKTEPCRSWVETRTCPYGRRCRFIHSDPPSSLSSPSQHQTGPASHSMSSRGTMVASAMQQHIHPQMHGVSQSSSAMASGQQQHNGGGVDAVSSHQVTSSHLSGSTTSPPSSMMMISPHHMYGMGHEMSAAQSIATPQQQQHAAALRLSSPYAQQQQHLSHHSHQQLSLGQQHYQQQQQQPFGGWSTTSPSSVGQSPYNSTPGNLGFGVPLFNGSPPMTSNSAEHLAAARASNAPWLNDIYQEDDMDEYDPLSESLRLTPLIEQLNLHAEPVSPSTTHPNGVVTTPATPIARPAPIGSRVSPDATSSISPTTSPTASTSSQSTDSTSDPTEKGKKKKTSRLNIFQRLSSK